MDESIEEETIERQEKVEDTLEQDNEETPEETVESFMDIEDDVRQSKSTVLSEGETKKARIINAERVDKDTIPSDYPVKITTGRALELVLELEQQEKTTVYVNWPDDDSPTGESEIGKLLSLHDLQETQIADLYGKEVIIEVSEGYFTLQTPSSKQGKESLPQLFASLILSYTVLLLGIFTGFSLSITLILFTVGTLLFIPFYTYKDSSYLQTHSDWKGGPLFWAAAGMIPFLNILSTLSYINQRKNSLFID